MRWRPLTFALVVLGLVFGLFAEPTTVNGGGTYGHVVLESLDGTGMVKLNGTTVSKEIQIVGCLIAQSGEIGSLDVIGEVNLTGTTVKLGGQIMGAIQTVRSTIEKPITILSQKAIFTTSKLSGITVKQDKSFKGKQTIELRLGTVVDGPIHFESGKGEVLLYQASQVLGPVTGGKVIKKT